MTSQENKLTPANLTARAKEILGSSEAAERWLQEPQPTLGGATAHSMLNTDEGRQAVNILLGRIEHGVFS